MTSVVQINTWIVAPYKKPYRDEAENAEFNNHVSMVRIRSEHCIGFLKGWFQSLKNLQMQIKDEKEHKLATLWTVACMVVHNFALKHEAQEKEDEGAYYSPGEDPFVTAVCQKCLHLLIRMSLGQEEART